MAAEANSEEVLAALARFRAADAEMHQRVRAHTSLGENEVRILQFLLPRHRDGQMVKPSEISRHLNITSASTTALLDRLERQGRVERVSHPSDRRSILIAPTPRATAEVADLVDAFDDRVANAVGQLDDAGRRAVTAFLESISDAADDISTAPGRSFAPASI